MVYTITLNPAVDYLIFLNELAEGGVNRAESESVFFGGKGINVSKVLKKLGVSSVALGFCAGFTGEAVIADLKSDGIITDFVKLRNGFTRINVKLKSDFVTEINGGGPYVEENDLTRFFDKLSVISENDVVVLSGGIPRGVQRGIYAEICEKLCKKTANIIVDAEGENLTQCLKYKPFLIKPNTDELSDIFGAQLKNRSDILRCAKVLQKSGARNVLVSMGAEGALLIDENGVKRSVGAPDGKVVSTVGAGDSTVAGFLAGYIKTRDFDFSLKMGVSAGSATAFCEGLASRELIDKVFATFNGEGEKR